MTLLAAACAPFEPTCSLEPGPVFRCVADGPLTLTVTAERVDHVATGDGSVAVWLLPPEAPFTFTLEGGHRVATGEGVTPAASGATIAVTGDPGHLGYVLVPDCGEVASLQWIHAADGRPYWTADLTAYDAEGLWAWTWTPDETLVAAVSPTRVIEVDPRDGLVADLTTTALGLPGLLHHDLTTTERGWILLTAEARDGLVHDRVTEVTRDGQVLTDVDTEPLIDGRLATAHDVADVYWSWAFPGAVSATHTNTIRADGDRWLMSWRAADAIVELDPSDPGRPTLVVEGRDGAGLEPTVSSSATFEAPHGAYRDDDGTLVLLDNASGDTARVVRLDRTGAVTLEAVDLGLVCPEAGGVEPLADGAVLATCAREKTVLRVDLETGSIPWRATSSCVAPSPGPGSPDVVASASPMP